MLKKYLIIIICCLFYVWNASAYEFLAEESTSANWSTYGDRSYGKYNSGQGNFQVSSRIRPDECRFYLTYENEGESNLKLLETAKEIDEYLKKIFNEWKKDKVKIETVNYGPEKSFGSIFRKEKNQVSVIFRITIKLDTDGETSFWDNSKLVAEVLDKVNKVKKDNYWGDKIKAGQITYSVNNIDKTRKELLHKISEEVREHKKAYSEINSVGVAQVLCDIDYGNLIPGTPTLQGIDIIMPYNVDYKLKEDKGE